MQVKQRCSVLEDHLVDLVVMAMERSEKMGVAQSSDDLTVSHLLWQHLSSQVIFFVLFQFASFPHMVLALYKKVPYLYLYNYYICLYYICPSVADIDVLCTSRFMREDPI